MLRKINIQKCYSKCLQTRIRTYQSESGVHGYKPVPKKEYQSKYIIQISQVISDNES